MAAAHLLIGHVDLADLAKRDGAAHGGNVQRTRIIGMRHGRQVPVEIRTLAKLAQGQKPIESCRLARGNLEIRRYELGLFRNEIGARGPIGTGRAVPATEARRVCHRLEMALRHIDLVQAPRGKTRRPIGERQRGTITLGDVMCKRESLVSRGRVLNTLARPMNSPLF